MQSDRQPDSQTLSAKYHLHGVSASSLAAIDNGTPGFSVEKAKNFLKFQTRIRHQLLNHPIIVQNHYTAWFSQGTQSLEQIKAFIVQFSVFSNQFLIAQTNKMINADTLESMRASKEILANEIGVRFKPSRKPATESDNGATEGTIEGSTFRFSAAHFEWLYEIAKKLGLSFDQIGKPTHGTKSTMFFCNELIRLYGGGNYQIAQASSYAVENWAAAGFWGELIAGFKVFNQRTQFELPLGFFIWHDRLESLHAEHTQEELEEYYFTHEIDEDTFIQYGNKMLDGVAVFWEGLDEQRRDLATH